MALPPQPFGTMVERGMNPASMMDGISVDIPVNTPMDFEGGAQVTETADGGALIEALSGMEAMSQEELIPFDANLAEFLEDDTWARSQPIWWAPMRTTSPPVRIGKKHTPEAWTFLA
jgi:hypothetical protein